MIATIIARFLHGMLLRAIRPRTPAETSITAREPRGTSHRMRILRRKDAAAQLMASVRRRPTAHSSQKAAPANAKRSGAQRVGQNAHVAPTAVAPGAAMQQETPCNFPNETRPPSPQPHQHDAGSTVSPSAWNHATSLPFHVGASRPEPSRNGSRPPAWRPTGSWNVERAATTAPGGSPEAARTLGPEAEPVCAPHRPRERVWPELRPRTVRALLAGVLLVAAVLRVWKIDSVGLNSDEAVYAGQGASIAGNTDLAPYFPTFRAHPLLFQTLVSVGFKIGEPEIFGRVSAAALGVATVLMTYMAGKQLYGRRAGLIAGAILALMPYHVTVTRQILLDGPMVLASTATLYLLARYAATQQRHWFYAGAVAMGLTFLFKESSIILIGSVYAFLALTPTLRTGIRHFIGAGLVFSIIISAFPIALQVAGKSGTGGSFLAWQLFRRPNHTFLFYPTVVPLAIGIGVVIAAALGMWLLRNDSSWRETLLLSWITVPVGFFQLFPVKGYQYLLPTAPCVAILAARFFAHWDARTLPPPHAIPLLRDTRARRVASSLVFLRHARVVPIALAVVLLSIAIPSWQRVQPSEASTFLAGSGGVPGGREAGLWIAQNVPAGARMMSVGPSMANILQYYGRRKVYGLSVSPNPLHRNPVYEAMKNPDRMIRDNELQYVVWDAFSADRSPFFSRKLIRYVERYNGHVVHTETVPVRSPSGRLVSKPVITIYEVSP
jgi:hypothetical protein